MYEIKKKVLEKKDDISVLLFNYSCLFISLGQLLMFDRYLEMMVVLCQ